MHALYDPFWWLMIGTLIALIIIILFLYILWLRRNHFFLERNLKRLSYGKPHALQDNDRITQTPIYRHFCHLAAEGVGQNPTEDDWVMLSEAIDEAYPGFMNRLVQLYRFTEVELHVTLLLKAKFAPAKIALLMCKSKESISSIRRRLSRKVLGASIPSPRKWDDFIKTL
jgi:hypothetical protein